MSQIALESAVERIILWVRRYFAEASKSSVTSIEVSNGLCGALSDAVTLSLAQTLDWKESGYAFDGVLPALITQRSQSSIRITGAAVAICHRQPDLMLPLLADIDQDLGAVTVRIGDFNRAIVYRKGGEARFAGVTETDFWPYVVDLISHS